MPFEVDVRDRIGEIVFDHPPVNAFDARLWLELPGIIHGLAERSGGRSSASHTALQYNITGVS